MYRRADGGLFK